MAHKKESNIKSEKTLQKPDEELDIAESTKPSDEQDVTENNIGVAQKDEEKELTLEQKLQKQVEVLHDKLYRTAAEFDNYKKRMARQFDEIIRSANDKIIIELLEVIDNFERALLHNNDSLDFEAYNKGMELIFNQMNDLIKKYDITPIEAIGKPFDPNFHEAMMQVDSDKYDEGIVALEINKGYMQGKRVIRHSKVGVSGGEKLTERKKENNEKKS